MKTNLFKCFLVFWTHQFWTYRQVLGCKIGQTNRKTTVIIPKWNNLKWVLQCWKNTIFKWKKCHKTFFFPSLEVLTIFPSISMHVGYVQGQTLQLEMLYTDRHLDFNKGIHITVLYLGCVQGQTLHLEMLYTSLLQHLNIWIQACQ